jgi:transposase
VFVQETKSTQNGKTYTSFLVRESFRTPKGPRSRTVCNITALPPHLRQLIASALKGATFSQLDSLQLEKALDFGGIAVLEALWNRLQLDSLLSHLGSPRQRSLLKAMVFARLLHPSSKLALKTRARGTLLAPACGLPKDEPFDEDELYDALDALSGNWCSLEKKLSRSAFQAPVSLVLYDLTSVYFEGAGPSKLARYGYSRDHRGDRPQIILAVATDSFGVPIHLSVLRGNRADNTTLQSMVTLLKRRHSISDAVFVFDGGMSSRINIKALEQNQLEFVTRLSNASLSSLIKKLPSEVQLELGDHNRVLDVEHEGKRYVIAGGPWRKQRDQERRALRMSKGEALLVKMAAVKRRRTDAQKLASQVGRALEKINAHKYFSYQVGADGQLEWERKLDAVSDEEAYDGWYLLHTNLKVESTSAGKVLAHYKNLLEVESAFCELKSYLQVRPVHHHRADRVVNHVRVCFLAYWLSARLSVEWRAKGETARVPDFLRELQSIRMGYLRIGKAGEQRLTRMTQVPAELNEKLARLDLLPLFSNPPNWANQEAV